MEQEDEPPSAALNLELWVIHTRLMQGLPPHVEDLETLLRVIDLLGLMSSDKHVKESDLP